MAEDFLLDRRQSRLRQETGGRAWMREFMEQGTYDFVEYYDDFHGDSLEHSGYATATGVDGSHDKIAGSLNGESSLDVGDGGSSGDNEYGGIALGLEWKGDNYATIAVRLKVSNVATVKIEAGFTDALADAGAVNALATPSGRADNYAVWCVDTDDTALWQAVGGKAGTDVKTEPTEAVATLATTYVTCVVATRLDAVRFQLLNAAEQVHSDTGWKANYIEGGTLITPWVFVQNRTGSIDRVVTIDYIRVWQRRQTQ
jgi:hypothetical protein